MVFSGEQMHFHGHCVCGDCHGIWHNWAVIHVVTAVLFVVVAGLHVQQHWAWFKSVARSLKNKIRVTLALSAVMVALVFTGLWLLFGSEGANSDMGIAHLAIGRAMYLLGAWHIVKRLPILSKGLRNLSKPQQGRA